MKDKVRIALDADDLTVILAAVEYYLIQGTVTEPAALRHCRLLHVTLTRKLHDAQRKEE